MLVLIGYASADAGAIEAPAAQVRPIGTYDQLKQVLEQEAQPGDIIEVQPGVYYATSPRIAVRACGTPDRPITIRGVIRNGRRPAIDGSRVNTSRGMLTFPAESHDIIIENLEFCHAAGTRHGFGSTVPVPTTSEANRQAPSTAANRGASERAYGTNAGAIYFQGVNITVRNCYSHHNENGWFASHEADYILIENCEIGFNGTLTSARHDLTHNFYFSARHQMIRNCYIHDPRDGQSFKSRGENTIFAFNWVDEDYGYSIEQASAGALNTLWLGNVVAKRSSEGIWQGRLLGVGDGTGVVHGTVVAVNNTFVTFFPRDHFVFTVASADANLVLINNVFAGPAEIFAHHNGKGTITGTNNWIRKGIGSVPAGLEDTIYGDDPGFMNSSAFDFRPAPDSPLIDAGTAPEKYSAALAVVLANAASGTSAMPSAPWMAALRDVQAAVPLFVPRPKDHGFDRRGEAGTLDIGAFEAVPPAK